MLLDPKDVALLTQFKHLIVHAPPDIVYVYKWEGDGKVGYGTDRVIAWVMTGDIVSCAPEKETIFKYGETRPNTRYWDGKPYCIDDEGHLDTLPANTVWVGPRDEIPEEFRGGMIDA